MCKHSYYILSCVCGYVRIWCIYTSTDGWWKSLRVKIISPEETSSGQNNRLKTSRNMVFQISHPARVILFLKERTKFSLVCFPTVFRLAAIDGTHLALPEKMIFCICIQLMPSIQLIIRVLLGLHIRYILMKTVCWFSTFVVCNKFNEKNKQKQYSWRINFIFISLLFSYPIGCTTSGAQVIWSGENWIKITVPITVIFVAVEYRQYLN